jgi:type I restriction enzyme, S subunit
MSELPRGWAEATLGEIAPLTYGKALVEKSRDIEGKVPVLGSSGRIGLHSQALTDRETVIIGRKGNVGAVFHCAEPCWVIDTAYFVDTAQWFNWRFLFHLLSHKALANLDRSTAIPGLSRDDYNKVRVQVAPLGEQDRIADEIEKQFTRLDAATTALKRVQANLKRYRASVLKAACEGRLVPTEAELARKEGRDYEPADKLLQRILRERRARWEADALAKMIASGKRPTDDHWRQKYKEPSAPDTANLPPLPEGWCWASIEQVSECLDSQRVPVNREERARRGGDVPYYGANGRVGWIDEYLFDEPLVLVVEDETFVGREIPFSYLIRGKSWVNNHAHILRAIEGLRIEYLNYSLAYYPFTPLTTGSTGRRKLTQKALAEAQYALPPMAEQARIVSEIERLLSVDDAMLQSIKANATRIERLRQSVLTSAFTGQLIPQDPTDEPASALLERIRAERSASVAKRPAGRTRKEPAHV